MATNPNSLTAIVLLLIVLISFNLCHAASLDKDNDDSSKKYSGNYSLGDRTQGDEQVGEHTVEFFYKIALDAKEVPATLDTVFGDHFEVLTKITVENLLESVPSKVTYQSGGPGKTYVTLNYVRPASSDADYYKYKVTLYGMPSTQTTSTNGEIP